MPVVSAHFRSLLEPNGTIDVLLRWQEVPKMATWLLPAFGSCYVRCCLPFDLWCLGFRSAADPKGVRGGIVQTKWETHVSRGLPFWKFADLLNRNCHKFIFGSSLSSSKQSKWTKIFFFKRIDGTPCQTMTARGVSFYQLPNLLGLIIMERFNWHHLQ